MKPFAFASALLLAVACCQAEIRTQTIEYKDGDVTCRGYLAYQVIQPNERRMVRSGVLVIPEWWGLTEYPKARARQLAELGYVAFVADMYGDGKTTADPKQAAEWAAIRGDRPKLRTRALAALTALKGQADDAFMNPNKIAAIGYCFGGTTVLELARAGAPVLGVVSFHGGLEMPGQNPAPVTAKILVCHGADDPMVPVEQVNAFQKQMQDAKADFQIITYSGAVHAFTNPEATSFNIPGIAYNEAADKRSWEAMRVFLEEVLK